MKKLLLFAFLILLLTGCGEKKLICSYSSSNSYYGSDSIYIKYTFNKKGNIAKYIVNEKISYNNQYLEGNNLTMDSLFEQSKEYCKNVPSSKNIKCNISKNGNSINVAMNYDVAKMTDKEKKELNLEEYISMNKEDIKKQFSSQGFTCK